jgi:hypothetical protein
MVWKLWWPALPFMLLIGGRIWCGVCPFGGLSDLALKLRKNAGPAPSALRRWGPWMGAFSVLGFGLAFLALGLEMNAGVTGIILIGMIALALGLSLLYRGRTFCRYLCPVGMITRVYSFFSWLRPTGVNIKYAGKACPVGQSPASLRQPSQCQLCGTCTGAGSAGISTSTTVSGVRIPHRLEFGRPEAALSLLLLGLMASDSVRMTSLFARYQQFALPYFGYNYRLSVIAGVSSLVGLVFVSQLLGARIIRSRGRMFEGMAFSYLPLTLGVFLSLALQHLRYGLWPSIQTLLAETRIVDWTGHMPPESVYFMSLPLKSVQFTLLAIGLYFSWKISRRALTGTGEAQATSTDSPAGGLAARRTMLLMAAAGFGALFLLPMSGAC